MTECGPDTSPAAIMLGLGVADEGLLAPVAASPKTSPK